MFAVGFVEAQVIYTRGAGLILICGGAGYIGSHMAQWLAAAGKQVAILDNLSTGHREAVKWGELYEADLLDPVALDRVFSANSVDAVMHFGAKSLVGESFARPYEYYLNNVVGTLNLLTVMQNHGVDKLVFSSTAAVYGAPMSDLIDERHWKNPINPYGASKLMVERILSDAAQAYNLRVVSLRYFNAAGAKAEHGIGESHACETHLIPNVLRSAVGSAPPLKVFGDDYPTPDGTCIRDYVHVSDLAQAHALALEFLRRRPGFHCFNLGNGQGFSVRQVIAAASEILGKSIEFEVVARRPGDPSRLVADSSLARAELGWEQEWKELEPIIESAWRWHRDQKF